MGKIILIILDGLGIGNAPDAELYGDKGSNTLLHIYQNNENLSLPNLENLGILNLIIKDSKSSLSEKKISDPIGCYGKMIEVSKGKDSTSGHWEIGGLITDFDFPSFPDGFPENLVKAFIELNNLKGILGNKPASGTVIINELGDEHCKTKFPIVYTSADSVFQIAAHEEVIPLKELYEICKRTREQLLINEYKVGRVIARPFLGENGKYYRTTNRKDFSILPHSYTMFDYLQKNGIATYGVGKIGDLYAYQGIDYYFKTRSNMEGILKTDELIESVNGGFIMTNLVDFDQNFGHRNDVKGFGTALKEFDDNLPKLMKSLKEDDILILTADHGNDPTSPSSDHTREMVPLLIYGKKIAKNIDLGTRSSFADLGNTVCDFYGIKNNLNGKSFLNLIK